MKNFTFAFIFLAIFSCKQNLESPSRIVTSDIQNYWEAYDKILVTEDSTQQMKILKELFIDQASEGQKALFQARNYTPEEYLANIHKYPKFWKDIRSNSDKIASYEASMENEIEKFRKLYPDLRPAKIYFGIGAFRTPGTTTDSMVLIGTEMTLTNADTDMSEFSERYDYFKNYAANDPIDDIPFLNIHEYVHTQQDDALYGDLLTQCISEGIAEFLAEKITGQESIQPSVIYGKENVEYVRKEFEKHIGHRYYRYWLWSQMENKFDQRDLGYIIGYEIARGIYGPADNKQSAIKELLELELMNPDALHELVDRSGYFSRPVKEMRAEYEASRPYITKIEGLQNESDNVKPGLKKIKVHFSEEMNVDHRGFDYGPMGADNSLRISEYIGFSEDKKSMEFTVNLVPNKKQQITISERFMSEKDAELKPYLISVTSTQ